MALDEAAGEAQRVLEVLVQVNVSGESTKSGFAPNHLPTVAERLHACSNLRVRELTTMAPFDAEESVLRAVFRGARDARTQLQAAGFGAEVGEHGDVGDYEVAVEEGATHVRLGTVLFGSRT